VFQGINHSMSSSSLFTTIANRLYKHSMSRAGELVVPVQTGALPWRLKRGKKTSAKAEVLLITGRRSGRWMIPKGWPIAGKTMADSAAQEAFEEAGIEGKIDPQAIGAFRHVKQHLLFGPIEVDILVHPLAVERELGDWPERGERMRKWFKFDEAAERVDSPELRGLIVEFGKQLISEPPA
jgi:8-oxo-dGTP pyrophosphatase MutT (NUDIX family)